MPNLSCKQCRRKILVATEMYFSGVTLSQMFELIRECAFPTAYNGFNKKKETYCFACIINGGVEGIRAYAVFNAHLFDPAIRGFYNLTQIELLNTVIPFYEEQTRKLLEFRTLWLTQLPESGYGAEVNAEDIANVIGNSVNG